MPIKPADTTQFILKQYGTDFEKYEEIYTNLIDKIP